MDDITFGDKGKRFHWAQTKLPKMPLSEKVAVVNYAIILEVYHLVENLAKVTDKKLLGRGGLMLHRRKLTSLGEVIFIEHAILWQLELDRQLNRVQRKGTRDEIMEEIVRITVADFDSTMARHYASIFNDRRIEYAECHGFLLKGYDNEFDAAWKLATRTCDMLGISSQAAPFIYDTIALTANFLNLEEYAKSVVG